MSQLNNAIEDLLTQYSANHTSDKVYLDDIHNIIQNLSGMVTEGSEVAKKSTYTEQLIMNKLIYVINNCLSLTTHPQIDMEWQDIYYNNLIAQHEQNIKQPSNSNISGILITALVAGALPMPLVSIPAGIGAGYAADRLIGKQQNKTISSTQESIQPIEPNDCVSAQVSYDTSELKKVLTESLSTMAGTFSLIGERIQKGIEENSNITPELKDVPDILPFMQQFLAYIQSQKECPDNLEVLGDIAKSILSNQGINIQDYDESFRSDFNTSFGKLPQGRTFRQMLPAFKVGDEVICKGQVLIEQNTDTE